MDFIRARSGEQKRIRIEQITNVAAELYVEIGYDKVTYSEIGRKLNFTRRNLYNYFRCKEDIFLTLLLQDIENMVEDAEKRLQNRSKIRRISVLPGPGCCFAISGCWLCSAS